MEKHSWYKQMERLRLCKYGFEVGITYMAKFKMLMNWNLTNSTLIPKFSLWYCIKVVFFNKIYNTIYMCWYHIPLWQYILMVHGSWTINETIHAKKAIL